MVNRFFNSRNFTKMTCGKSNGKDIKMSRFAKANVTIDDLKNKILEFTGETDIQDAIWSLDKYSLPNPIRKDLSKINFDMENSDLMGEYNMPGTEDLKAFEMLGDFPVAWICAGGDWEQPLLFVLYIGDKGELRAYIPKDGNAYNHKEKCAYGSEEDQDESENFDESNYKFDANKLREDVIGRIVVKQKD